MSLSKFCIVLAQPLHQDAMSVLRQSAEVTVAGSAEADVLAPYLRHADGLIFRYGRITREIFESAPKLRVVAKPGVGYDGIDLSAATERGIAVALCPHLNARAVAEHTLALILACGKNLFESALETRAGNYECRSLYVSDDIAGKTVAVCGFGHIGREVAALCSAIGMRVIVYSRHAEAEELEKLGYIPRKSLAEAAGECDFLTLHLPASAETSKIVNADILKAMRPGSYLINTARSELVDEEALAQSLKAGHLAGAGLDFLQSEPIPREHPILSMNRVIVTPHMAALSAGTARRMAVCAAQATIKLLGGDAWEYIANPEVFNHSRWCS